MKPIITCRQACELTLRLNNIWDWHFSLATEIGRTLQLIILIIIIAQFLLQELVMQSNRL